MTSTLVSSDFRMKSNLTLGTGPVEFSTFWARQGPVPAALAIRSQTGEPRRNPPSRYTGQWAIRGTIYRAVGAEHFSHCGLGNHISSVSELLTVCGRGHKGRSQPCRIRGQDLMVADRTGANCQSVLLHIKIPTSPLHVTSESLP